VRKLDELKEIVSTGNIQYIDSFDNKVKLKYDYLVIFSIGIPDLGSYFSFNNNRIYILPTMINKNVDIIFDPKYMINYKLDQSVCRIDRSIKFKELMSMDNIMPFSTCPPMIHILLIAFSSFNEDLYKSFIKMGPKYKSRFIDMPKIDTDIKKKCISFELCRHLISNLPYRLLATGIVKLISEKLITLEYRDSKISTCSLCDMPINDNCYLVSLGNNLLAACIICLSQINRITISTEIKLIVSLSDVPPFTDIIEKYAEPKWTKIMLLNYYKSRYEIIAEVIDDITTIEKDTVYRLTRDIIPCCKDIII
jgi:hypothetical protein